MSNCDNCYKMAEWFRKSLKDALEANKNGSNVNRAPKIFDIPYATLWDHYAGRFSSSKAGKHTHWSTVTERLLFTLIIFMPDIGFALSKLEIIEVVKNSLQNQT